jgi:hypothetical protein
MFCMTTLRSNPDRDAAFQAQMARLERVQILLAAAISKHVGYTGPLEEAALWQTEAMGEEDLWYSIRI